VRLSEKEVFTLKKSLFDLDEKASLYLFGSRVDDAKRGGDIDLLIVSKKITGRDIRKIRLDFFKKFGEQKIDIVLDNENNNDPFIQIIKKEAIQL